MLRRSRTLGRVSCWGLAATVLVCSPVWAADLPLQNATATFSQGSSPNPSGFYSPEYSIDGTFTTTGWAIFDGNPDPTSAQTAAFETVSNAGLSAGTQLTLLMNFGIGGSHQIGRWRLSATTDDRSTFADGLANGGDVTASWTELTPIALTSINGASMTPLGDNSVLAGGTLPDTDLHRAVFHTTLTNITGFRLEAIADPSLPTDGPGRQPSNGNFVLEEFQLDAASLPVTLQNATATLSQAGSPDPGGFFSPNFAIDNNHNTVGWAIFSGTTSDQTAVFETASNVGTSALTNLTITLGSDYAGAPQHNLGRFRISVTTDDRSQFADGLANGGDVTANWTVIDPQTYSSLGGATLLELGDNSILASGTNTAQDVYTLTAQTGIVGITGVRIEVIEDAALPDAGPGRSGNGNFVLSEFAVQAERVNSAPNSATVAGGAFNSSLASVTSNATAVDADLVANGPTPGSEVLSFAWTSGGNPIGSTPASAAPAITTANASNAITFAQAVAAGLTTTLATIPLELGVTDIVGASTTATPTTLSYANAPVAVVAGSYAFNNTFAPINATGSLSDADLAANAVQAAFEELTYDWTTGGNPIGNTPAGTLAPTGGPASTPNVVTFAQAVAAGLTSTTASIPLTLDASDRAGTTASDTGSLGYTNAAPTPGLATSTINPDFSNSFFDVFFELDLGGNGVVPSFEQNIFEFDLSPAASPGDVGDGFLAGSTLPNQTTSGTLSGTLNYYQLIALFGGHGTFTAYANVRDSAGAFASQAFQVTVVPEPATLLIWLGLATLGGGIEYRRRRRPVSVG